LIFQPFEFVSVIPDMALRDICVARSVVLSNIASAKESYQRVATPSQGIHSPDQVW
jgi:hypothetical protein